MSLDFSIFELPFIKWNILIVILRESFEALLIIGILTSLIRKTGEVQNKLFLIVGVLFGIVASLLVGYSLVWLPSLFSDQVMTVLEVIFPLLAAFLLIHMIWWMSRQSKIRTEEFRMKAVEHLKNKNTWAFGALAFLAIFREGIETVLFLSGELMQNSLSQAVVFSIVFGFVTALFIYLIFTNFLRQMGPRWFFGLTSILLLLFSVQLIYGTFQQFVQRGWIEI